jgi:hypothetical protein
MSHSQRSSEAHVRVPWRGGGGVRKKMAWRGPTPRLRGRDNPANPEPSALSARGTDAPRMVLISVVISPIALVAACPAPRVARCGEDATRRFESARQVPIPV